MSGLTRPKTTTRIAKCILKLALKGLENEYETHGVFDPTLNDVRDWAVSTIYYNKYKAIH